MFPRERRKKKLPASQLRPALQSIRQLSDSVSCTHSCQVRKLLSLYYYFFFSAAWIFSLQTKQNKKKNEIRTWKVKDKLRGEKKKKKLTSCTNAENCDGGTKFKKHKKKNNLFESCKSLFLLATKCPFSRLVFFPIVRTQRQGKRISFIHSGSFVSPSLQPPSIVLLMAFRRMATCRDHFSFFRQLFLRSTTSEEIRKAMNKHANVGWVQPDITR